MRTLETALASLLLASSSFSQTSWNQLSPATSPPARGSHAMWYDAVRGRTLLFGGGDLTPSPVLGDTWSWDGNTWSMLAPSQSPSPRWGTMIVDDFIPGRALLFGGSGRSATAQVGDTWRWDGANWTQLSPTTAPAARWLHTMVFDDVRRQVVLFGGRTATGTVVGDTWIWSGNTWAQRTPAVNPPARWCHAMAFDHARGRTVMFGGSPAGTTLFADTWEWDGSTWTQRSPNNSPAARWCHAMTYDAARQRVILYGGRDNVPNYFNDLWEWDGTDWTRISTTTMPSARQATALAFDRARQKTVLFGGFTNSTWTGDTWEYSGPFRSLTADVTRVSLAAQGRQVLTLDAGSAHANKLYFVLGSLSGTTPGLALNASVTLPLNIDPYLTGVTLAFPNQLMFTSSLGALDTNGRGSASWTAIPLLAPLVSSTFHHAYVVIGNGSFDFASNAVPLELVQ